jgi:hypothetical protein
MVETPGGSAPQPPEQQPGAWPEPPAQPAVPPPAAPPQAAPPPQEYAAPQAQYAAPPPAAAPEAPKKKSKWWLWVGCGCLVLILLACVAAVALGGLSIFGITSAINKAGPVVQTQADLALLKAGQIEQVQANASDDFRTNVSADRMREFVDDNPLLKNWTGQEDIALSYETKDGRETGSVKLTLKDASGSSQRYDFVYTKVDKGWKLLSIEKIDGSDGDGS